MAYYKKAKYIEPGLIYTGYVFNTGPDSFGSWDTRPLRKKINPLIIGGYKTYSGSIPTTPPYNTSVGGTPILFFIPSSGTHSSVSYGGSFSLNVGTYQFGTGTQYAGSKNAIDYLESNNTKVGTIYMNYGYLASSPTLNWRTTYYYSLSEYNPRFHITSSNSNNVSIAISGKGEYGYQFIYLGCNANGGTDAEFFFRYGPSTGNAVYDYYDGTYNNGNYTYGTIGETGSFTTQKTVTLYTRSYVSSNRYFADEYPVGIIVFSKVTGAATVLLGDK